jgi:hypothetical protein
MNNKFVDIGRIIAFIGVIPMIGVAFIVGVSFLPNISDCLVQLLASSMAPGFFIWVMIAEGNKPSWGGSGSKDIIKALLIIFAGILAIVQVPYISLYNSMHNMINQTGAKISILGAIVIIIGALWPR